MNYYHTVQSPVGELFLVETGGKLSHLLLEAQTTGALLSRYRKKKTSLLAEASHQLSDYFSGKRQEFSLPLAPQGTPFQKKVWGALLTVPYGETASYKDIAEQVGCPKGFQAVGGANSKNPIAIVIPCHRVIAADGTLGGYSYGLAMKSFLLELEQRPPTL